MRNLWRLSYGIPSWILYLILILAPLCLLGWILIPIAAACKAYYYDSSTEQYHWSWKIMTIFDNTSDGIVDPGYSDYTSMFGKIVYWTALRNPVNNIKIVPVVCCKEYPDRIRFLGSLGNCLSHKDVLTWRSTVANQTEVHKYDLKLVQWWFIWQGAYTGFYWTFNLSGHLWLFWIGWKLKPYDVLGPIEAYRLPRAPSGIQLNEET